MRSIAIVFLTFATLATAATPKPPESKLSLIGARGKELTPVENAADIVPGRVYAKYEAGWSRWVIVISDERGKIPGPTEALMPGSVLRGELLGESSGSRYLLTKQSEWVKTEAEPKQYFWVNDDPPRLKVVRVESKNR